MSNLITHASWQPIETAPKDGTLIDLWTVNDERLADCRWHKNEYDDDDPGHWEQRYAETYTCFFRIDDEVTHWLPLPLGPFKE